MNIICKFDLSKEEGKQLSGILGCSTAELSDELSGCASAALEEYARMIIGQKVFTRGSDFIEYRLFLLIKHVLNNEIPDEQKICDYFQMTVTQARALLRSVMSKYQYELDAAIKQSQRKTLECAIPSRGDSGDYNITVDNENIINSLNRELLSIDGTLPPISRKRNTVSTYILKPASRDHLFRHFGIKVE